MPVAGPAVEQVAAGRPGQITVLDVYGGQRSARVLAERGGRGSPQHGLVGVQSCRVPRSPAVRDLPGDVSVENRARTGPGRENRHPAQLGVEQLVVPVQEFAQSADGVRPQFVPFDDLQAVDQGEFVDLAVGEPVAVAGAAPQLDEPLPHPPRNGGDPLGLSGGHGLCVREGHRLDDRGPSEHRAEAGRDARVDGLREQGAQGGRLGVRRAGHDAFVPLPGALQAESGAYGRRLADDLEQLADVVGPQRLAALRRVREGVDEPGGCVALLTVVAAEGGRIAGGDDGRLRAARWTLGAVR